MIRHALPVTALALALHTAPACADPPPPKVCVAVAGDPDEAVRASAETLSDAAAHREGFRAVADSDARAALRGESVAADSAYTDLAAARRTLRGEDRDATALDTVASRLGCGLVVTLSARPAGTLLRVYDPVTHAWPASREMGTVDGEALTTVLSPALAARANPPTRANPSATGAANASNRAATAPAPTRSAWSRAWPWVVVGGVALAVVGAYFLADDASSSSQTRVTVVHPGAP